MAMGVEKPRAVGMVAAETTSPTMNATPNPAPATATPPESARAQFPPRQILLPLDLSAHSFQALPTAEALAEGGYETRGLYGPVGFFSAKAPEVVVAKVRELAEKAGRKE